MAEQERVPRWMRELEEEDWQFVLRFLLASGSLKEVAAQYGISYPTVRLRMNRLIEKIRVLQDDRTPTAFHRKVKLLVAEQKLDVGVARALIRAFEETKEEERNDGI